MELEGNEEPSCMQRSMLCARRETYMYTSTRSNVTHTRRTFVRGLLLLDAECLHPQWSHPALKILVSVAVMKQTAATIMLHIQLTVTVLASLSQSGMMGGCRLGSPWMRLG